MIPVTKTCLPPLQESIPFLEQILDSQLLTINGSFQNQQALCDYLGVATQLSQNDLVSKHSETWGPSLKHTLYLVKDRIHAINPSFDVSLI